MKYLLQLFSIWLVGGIVCFAGATFSSINGKGWFLVLAGYFWASFPQVLTNFLIGRVWKYFYLLPLAGIFLVLVTSLDGFNAVMLPYGLVNASFIFFEQKRDETE